MEQSAEVASGPSQLVEAVAQTWVVPGRGDRGSVELGSGDSGVGSVGGGGVLVLEGVTTEGLF